MIGHIRMFHCLEVINQRKVNKIWDINFEQCQVIEIPKNLAWIFIGEVKKCLTECTPHGLKVLGSKVRVCASTQCGAPKWRLHCVAIGNSHHPHNNPASALLAALDSELAVLKRKLHKTCLLSEYKDSGNTDRNIWPNSRKIDVKWLSFDLILFYCGITQIWITILCSYWIWSKVLL